MEQETEVIQKMEMPWQKQMDGREVQIRIIYTMHVYGYGGAPYGDCAFARSGGSSLFGFWGTSYNCGHQHLLVTSSGGWIYSTWCGPHSWTGYHGDCVGAGMYTNAYYGRACIVAGSGV